MVKVIIEKRDAYDKILRHVIQRGIDTHVFEQTEKTPSPMTFKPMGEIWDGVDPNRAE